MQQGRTDNLISKLSIRCIAISLVLLASSTRAQERPVAEARQTISPDLIEAAKKTVETNTNLDETVRVKALELYDKALEELKDESLSRAELARLQKEVKTAGEDLSAVRRDLEAPTEALQKPLSSDELPIVQQRLTKYEQELQQAEKRQSDLAQKIALRAQLRSEIPSKLEETKKALAAVEAELATEPAADALPAQTAARRAFLSARQRSLTAKASLLSSEIPAFDATAALLTARSDLAAREVSQARKRVAAWQEYVNQRRRTDAENNAREAQELEKFAMAPLKPMAKALVKLADRLVVDRGILTTNITTTLRAIQLMEDETKRRKAEFEEITERAKVAGFTNAVGVLLQKQRSALPNVPALREEISKRQETISEAHIRRLDFENQRSGVSDVESQIEALVASQGPEIDDVFRTDLENNARRILQARVRYLDGVIQDLNSYMDQLTALDTRQRALLTQTETQNEYIAEHILWVRSTNPLSKTTLKEAASTAAWLVRAIPTIGRCLGQDAASNLFMWLPVALVFCTLLFLQPRLKVSLRTASEVAARRNTTLMKPTLRALVLTALVASPWPVLLGLFAWRLLEMPRTDTICTAAGIAFRGCAVILFSLDMLRHSCRSDGLGVSHFDWPAKSISTIRRPLRLILVIVTPLVFFVLLLERTGVDFHRTSLGRFALMLSLLVVAYCMHRVTRPHHFTEQSGKAIWIRRSRYLWYAFGVGVPVVLFVLAAIGYQYSARQLGWRLVESGWLVLLVVLAASLLARWQLLTYRSLAMKQARKRREERQQAGEGVEAETTIVNFDDQAETLSESNKKLEKLQTVLFGAITFVGLAMIWNDVLPAFGFLGKVQLWESGIASELINGVEKHEWITLTELLLAIAVVGITLMAARNLPGLLEFAVLQRLPVDAGFKYATSTVFRYVITTIGIIFAFRVIGIGWSNVQWLVAAMTVGLGFGLQEIFANFVSGLILLFERPIRVGDTVTVGSVTGDVARIRIRATTIVDWDRKELVVPNREFVTGQLVNWTLSDSVLRLTVRVGVAYGSDTRLATELLYRVAAENESVLNEPAPFVIFKQFGESSLDFELRCFVGSLPIYRSVEHELNLKIDDLFRKHNIEIAFPQRDLHIRSAEAPIAIQHPHQEVPSSIG